MVSARKQELLDARDWLRDQMAARGPRLSGRMIATVAIKQARVGGDPVNITQQQIDAIKNATEDKGPAKIPSWWRHVQSAFESGRVDELLAVKDRFSATTLDPEPRGEFQVVDSNGKVVGRLSWTAKN